MVKLLRRWYNPSQQKKMYVEWTRAGSAQQSEDQQSRSQESEAARASSRSSSQREQLYQAVDTAILKVGFCTKDSLLSHIVTA